MKKVASSSRSLFISPCLLALLALSIPAHGQPVSQLVPWGDSGSGQANIPAGLTNAVAIASGGTHNLALKANGTVTAWGNNVAGQTNVPPGLSGVRAVAASGLHSLALKTDGTLVPWGSTANGLTTVPVGLTNAVAIGAGATHNLAIKSDGKVAGWGDNSSGQLNIPSDLSNVVTVAGGLFHSTALKANGTVVAWGNNSFHQLDIPAGLSNVVAIAVGNYQTLALRANGTVVAWGFNNNGQINVPAGLSNVISVACGSDYSLAVKANGTVVAWGNNSSGQAQPPVGLSNVVAISAGNAHTLALVGSAPAIITQPQSVTVVEYSNATFSVSAAGLPAVSYQWRFNGTNLTGATGSSYTLTPAHMSDAGSYSVCVSNTFGSVTSTPALLTVNPSLVARCADVTVSANANCVANASIDAGSFDPSGGSITLTQSPPGPYPLGTNVVTLLVTSDRGGSASCTAQVIVLDQTPPQFTPSANIVRSNDLNQCGAIVTFAQPKASDTCSAVTSITCTPPSGSFFPVGTTVVQCAATDAAGNMATTSFTVTVLDRTPPKLTPPANIRRTNDLNQCGAIVTFAQPTATDTCSAVTLITCTPPSGSFFPVGKTVVQCAATDVAGNTATTNFTVTVCNRQAPQVTPPADIVRSNALNQCGAIVTFAQPTASNACSGVISITCTPPSGSFFPVGTTVVQCTATDVAGNMATANFTVTVLDRTPPKLTPPANVVRSNDLNQCGAIVNFKQPVATDTCSAVTSITCTPPSGSFFPVGKTVVRCAVTDAAGNTAVTNFTVTVCDRQPPTIVCPADMVVTNAHHAATSIVTYTPAASDNCPGLGPVVCNPPSGSAFTVGVHTIQCFVTDAAGNASVCSFHVTVWPGNKPPVPIIQISPLVTLPGCTNLTVLAPDSTNANIICDGSKSYDPDDATFRAAWFVGHTYYSTDLVASVTLPLGLHTITLVLDDTFPSGKSSASVQVQVISPEDAIGLIADLVEHSGLPVQRQKPLLASLDAAMVSAAEDNLHSELGQLGAFENKVRAQLGHTNPALANQLLHATQQLIEALTP